MANETRPRRESSSTSRIRKAALSAPASESSDDNGREPLAPQASAPVDSPAPGGNDYRDREPHRERVEREPYRSVEERPADREPIRLIRDRNDRESGVPVRERLAARDRDRGEREPGPLSRDRDRANERDRDREGGPPIVRDRDRDG